MSTYYFEHYQKGEMVGLVNILAKSTQEAVSLLSDKYLGVFKYSHKGN